MEILSDLILPGDPDQPMEPVTKQYADGLAASEVAVGGAEPTVAGGLPELWVDTAATSDQGIIVCTSSTRPASPSDGTFIYETNTKLRYFSHGGQWYLQGEQVIFATSTSGGYTGFSLPQPTNGLKLRIVWRARSDTAGEMYLMFNNDSSNNYSNQYLYGFGSNVAAASVIQGFCAIGTADPGSAGFASGEITILNAWDASPNTPKTWYGHSYDPRALSTSVYWGRAGFWTDNVSPYYISVIRYGTTVGNMVSGSSIICYASSTLG